MSASTCVADSPFQQEGRPVEFRCMIQDSFGSEIYIDDKNVMCDRIVFYCINIPGENDWVCQHTSQTDHHMATGFISPQQYAEQQLRQPYDSNNRNQRIGFNLVNKSYPIPGGTNGACLIKLYGDQSRMACGDLKVNDLIHVTGYLEPEPEPEPEPESEPESESKNPTEQPIDQRGDEANGAANGNQRQQKIETNLQFDMDFEPNSDFPMKLVPRVHVKTIRKLPHINPLLPAPLADNHDQLDKTATLLARARLSTIITQLFGGDSLTAEYLILSLISGIHKRKDVTTLGQMTLGLIGFKPTMQFLIDKIAQLVSMITTHSHYIDMSIANLNNLCFTPKKDHENNKMIAGSLQLPAGLYLMLNETALSEGTLNAQGTENISTLSHIIKWQRHNYDFKFHRVEIETDFKILVFSEGKSLLPVPYSIRLEKNDDETVAAMKQACNSVDDFLSEELLNMLRYYVSSLKDIKNYTIPEAIQKTIQDDFVEWRKQRGPDGNATFSAEDLSSYLSLARLLAISKGEMELSLDIWKELCQMESKRRERLMAN